MKKPWLLPLCVLVVLLDLALTFAQNYHMPFDGDLAAQVVPRADYSRILQDPFGWAVLTKNAVYAVPNRFFAFGTIYWYFRHVPLWLQPLLSPISSAYAAMALFTTAMQVLLLYVLGWYVTGTQRLSSTRLWLALVLLLPFFQTTGYHSQMSLVTTSISFAWGYTFPLLLLLVFLWPLYEAARTGQPLQLTWPQLGSLLLLGVVLAFNGPIVPGTVLVLVLGVGLHVVWRRQWLTWQPALLWGWLAGLCLYSLYIGRNNSENLIATLPLWERYKLLPKGIFEQLTVRLGLPLLLIGCLLNAQLIRWRLPRTAERQHLLRWLRWLGLFSLVYIALLPFGGYRFYRPYILRYDTILPITVGLVVFYGLSTTYLLPRLQGSWRRGYTAGVVLIAAIFINADLKLRPNENNTSERRALEQLAQAGPGPAVQLPDSSRVMAWEVITTPNESITQAELLNYWGVTKGLKLYYYPPGKQRRLHLL
jgi:hypothetical protein